ncbi:AAA family ATPase [Roseitranquillus sediminis]|uniref:AAA family ATPase n=1 Tax=Roseitranquillus sediminis TaxID=2809051 RepID=UPI001D0C1684|nr:AAA family ATPase [Roseitranquillus sediminis]MBM9593079.1 AAA family ATPase [Roseitranquillus sediminis]
MRRPALVVIGGLPATGKTTIARHFAEAAGALHLRIDSIEQALRDATGLGDDVGPAGYAIAYAVARDNLRLGHVIVADCVNPAASTRDAWRMVAAGLPAPCLEVEVVCSDAGLHRRRAEVRETGIDGLAPPGWPAIRARRYEPWEDADLVLDTARLSPAEAVERVLAALLPLAEG